MAFATSAETAAMAEASRHVDNVGQNLAAIQRNVQQAVDATSTGYNSLAAVLFRSTMEQWHTDFTSILQGLEQIRVALVGTRKTIETGIEQDRQSANQIASMLNGGGNV